MQNQCGLTVFIMPKDESPYITVSLPRWVVDEVVRLFPLAQKSKRKVITALLDFALAKKLEIVIREEEVEAIEYGTDKKT